MAAVWLILLIFVVIAAVFAAASRGRPTESNDLIKVKVKRVTDGDGVMVSGAEGAIELRLYGIDCPEYDQDWGNIAKAGLIKLIGGRSVYLEFHGTDHYERTLATIYVKHSTELINVNERMVMLGHAWVMRKFYGQLPRNRKHQLNKLEKWARSKRVGLWKSENPIPPWQWRKRDSA